MPIELVVFDMAGTTVRDKNYVAIAFQQAMQAHGYHVAVEQVNPIMGYEKPLAIRMMLRDLETETEKITADLVSAIHSEFVSKMISFYSTANEIEPLPDVEHTFRILRDNGIKIALNTGFSRNIADVIIRRLGWEDKIDLLVASDQVSSGRPAADMINKIMLDLQVDSPDRVAKVGDTEVDINEGINAKCKYVVGITTGAFTRAELEPYHPTHIVDNISDVIQIVLLNGTEPDSK